MLENLQPSGSSGTHSHRVRGHRLRHVVRVHLFRLGRSVPELMKTGFTSDMDGLAKVSNEFEQDRELMAFSRMYVKS